MPFEIERKFKLKTASVIAGLSGTPIFQSYVARGPVIVRVRRTDEGASLALKSGHLAYATRHEWEYAVPTDDALVLEKLPGVYGLSKTRFKAAHQGLVYEIDKYHGPLEGLFTVEVELTSAQAEIALPSWVGEEVTGHFDWDNEVLARFGLPPTTLLGKSWRMLRRLTG